MSNNTNKKFGSKQISLKCTCRMYRRVVPLKGGYFVASNYSGPCPTTETRRCRARVNMFVDGRTMRERGF